MAREDDAIGGDECGVPKDVVDAGPLTKRKATYAIKARIIWRNDGTGGDGVGLAGGETQSTEKQEC